ncbi:hypothetical protein BGHDH14_bgh05363 [Blumeria hordei DH14]|uniref:Uncharacterized protein n=1 Tax=Blumeria graminis f. sp. hordei (strain DH14) TaxID=546991 RepID=N1JKC3_BLUG1|nr:hypothetical protein BGHDH14_bgh05363 [Blumeria hordei DH14]
MGPRSLVKICVRPYTGPCSTAYRFIHSLPLKKAYGTSSTNIIQPSFWMNMVPKPLRAKSPTKSNDNRSRNREWNPSTFFIVIFLLIGSNAIQMIALKKDFVAFNRRSEAKIRLLKEIIEKIQRGERVDVERLLGTGNNEMEQEWHDVIHQIQNGAKTPLKPSEDLDKETCDKIQKDEDRNKMPEYSNKKYENIKIPPGFF